MDFHKHRHTHKKRRNSAGTHAPQIHRTGTQRKEETSASNEET